MLTFQAIKFTQSECAANHGHTRGISVEAAERRCTRHTVVSFQRVEFYSGLDTHSRMGNWPDHVSVFCSGGYWQRAGDCRCDGVSCIPLSGELELEITFHSDESYSIHISDDEKTRLFHRFCQASPRTHVSLLPFI